MRPQLSGLQAERTLLAWERTALGLLANGALFMLRGTDASGPALLIPAAAALALAILAAVIGVRRRRRIARCLLGSGTRTHTVPAPTIEVLMLGAGMTTLCLLTLAVTVVSG